MASNETYVIPDTYQNTTPAPALDQKTLNKMVWRSLFLQGSFNYERMQSCGWLYGILPGLEKIHADNKDDLAASMSHNMEFFNTHPFLVTFVMGIVLSLEQNKVDIPTIRAVRVAAMGPLGGIGDALFWFTLVPITAGITSNMAIAGNLAAPFIFLIVFNVFQFVIRFWLMNTSYKMGVGAIDMLTANAKEFTRAASILGVFVIGCLTVCYGGTKLGLKIPNGTTNTTKAITSIVSNDDVSNFDNATAVDLGNGYSEVTVNTNVSSPVYVDIQSILDGICPKLIPLGLTLMLYALMTKRRWTPIKGICLLLAIGLVGGFIGIW